MTAKKSLRRKPKFDATNEPRKNATYPTALGDCLKFVLRQYQILKIRTDEQIFLYLL